MTARSEKRVIPLELFFDLVFVFALTQVTALMSDDPTWQGLARGMLVLAALWWAWGAYAWLTDEIDADEDLPRLAMFTSMTAMLIVALAVPDRLSRSGSGPSSADRTHTPAAQRLRAIGLDAL